MFSKSIGVKDYNEAELYAILEALCMLVCVHQTKLIVESDLSNAISWVSASSGVLGSSNSSLTRTKHYPCRLKSANAMANVLAKQGADCCSPFIVFPM